MKGSEEVFGCGVWFARASINVAKRALSKNLGIPQGIETRESSCRPHNISPGYLCAEISMRSVYLRRTPYLRSPFHSYKAAILRTLFCRGENLHQVSSRYVDNRVRISHGPEIPGSVLRL